MSQPQFPTNPPVDRGDVINQVISSIASEELALSHILNAEGEKIQYAIGTIPGLIGGSTVDQVRNVNSSVEQLLGNALENQILLTGKLSDTLRAPVIIGVTGATGMTGAPGAMGATGAENAASVINPVLSLSQFSNEFEVSLASGATVELQMFTSLLGTAVLLNNAAGASLMIIRLS